MCAPPLPRACHDAIVISIGSRQVRWPFALLALGALVAGVWIGGRWDKDGERDAVAAPAGGVTVVPGSRLRTTDHSATVTTVGKVSVHLLGRSVRGRPILAYELGDPLSRRHALVVGYVHGDERAGLAIVRELRARAKAISGVDLWVVPTTNPDGGAANTRQNARGVDLNRNFPAGWRRLPRGTFYSGTGPLSEPESKIAHALIRRLKPDVSIWYHQHAQLVDASGGDPAVERRYATLVGLPFKPFTRPPGSITTWTNRTYRGTTAFVVELPPGSLSPGSAARHARAVLALAEPARASAAAATTGASRLAIGQRRIPFSGRRMGEMAAYSVRHYGLNTFRIVGPHMIVEHWTDGNSFASAFNTFRQDVRDPELNELPGTCAHFVIDTSGRIYQLVDVRIMCRHAFGVNWTSIGIEHVGLSDAQVMGDARQLASSLALTAWLRCRFNIKVRDVLGHAETFGSPWLRERKRALLKNGTHSDMGPAAMRRYRALLGARRCA